MTKYNFKIDIEEPYQDVETVSIEEAQDRYNLDADDLYTLNQGTIVWINGTALTKAEEEE